jgi:NodT family efflux transporter outer membrane factor (OMF) lipoprotein
MSDVAERTLAQREQLLRLTRQRIGAGLDTQIELKVAQAAVPQAQAMLLQAQAARELAIHRLAALAGYGTDRYAQFKRPTVKLDTVLPLPDTLPIDLLARRPDLLAARLRVEAAGAGREAARAAFYPDVNLKAFIGLQAIGLDQLFDSGAVIYGAGPALHLPIFETRRLQAGYKAATAEVDTAIADYNAAVLDAVRQSADQISLGDSFDKQIAAAQSTLQAATAAHALAQQRYRAGLSTQLVVLNAESQMLAARRDLVELHAKLAIARVTLLLTLGGSFDPAHSAAAISGASS